ncbi:MAG: DUF4123 domain-containing protein [Pirellulales bacterium]|nr:DUF4123 domain-containing protein [Pirellulales bacterium]
MLVRRDISMDELRVKCTQAESGMLAVLDACDEPRVPSMLRPLTPSVSCLYQGDAEINFGHEAPYLAYATPALFDWVYENLWLAPWGILLASSSTFSEVRQHLRRYVLVKNAQGSEMFFRFYDPRVLPMFLPTCPASEAAKFFGPIDQFYVTRRDGTLESLAWDSASR